MYNFKQLTMEALLTTTGLREQVKNCFSVNKLANNTAAVKYSEMAA